LLAVVSRVALGQGTIQFKNYASGGVLLAPIYDMETNCEVLQIRGNTSAGRPAGCRTYTGAPLSGTGFTLELLAGRPDWPDNWLIPIAQTTFRTGAGAGLTILPPAPTTNPFVGPGEQ